MKYNETLNKEYKRSEERILKVISRINNTFNNDSQILQQKINLVIEKINDEDIKKKENLIKIKELNNNIKNSFKDLTYLRQVLESINKNQHEIKKIEIDISSYQKILN